MKRKNFLFWNERVDLPVARLWRSSKSFYPFLSESVFSNSDYNVHLWMNWKDIILYSFIYLLFFFLSFSTQDSLGKLSKCRYSSHNTEQRNNPSFSFLFLWKETILQGDCRRKSYSRFHYTKRDRDHKTLNYY